MLKKAFMIALIAYTTGFSFLTSTKAVSAQTYESKIRIRVTDRKRRIRLTIPLSWDHTGLSNDTSSTLLVTEDIKKKDSFYTRLVKITVSKDQIPIPKKYSKCSTKKVFKDFPITRDRKTTTNLIRFSECGDDEKGKPKWYTMMTNKFYPKYGTYHQVIVQRNEPDPKIIDSVTAILNTSDIKLIIK